MEDTMAIMRTRARSCAYLAIVTGLALVAVGSIAAAGSFDGSYNGHQTALRTDPTTCPSLDEQSTAVVIRDNHFQRRWGKYYLSVDVAGDGTIHSQTPIGSGRRQVLVKVDGKIANGNLEADIIGAACAAHLSLKKS